MKKFLLLCFSFGFAISVWAQDRVVTGKLTSKDDGSALPGVNVILKGTTSGTVTDADGSYRISVPSGTATLIFSFIGYATQEVVVGDRTIVDVPLENDSKQLSEVVVTGAGGLQARERELGTANSIVTPEVLSAGKAVNMVAGLQGKVPGLNISAVSSGVNPNYRIILRGMRSMTGNNEALIVLDGVIVPSDVISNMNMGDVESINVLRGAGAAALYGSQASNGALIITTKRGKKGKLDISASQNVQFQQVAFYPKMQNKFGSGGSGYGVNPDGTGFFSQYENQSYGPAFDGTDRPLGAPQESGYQDHAKYSYNNAHERFWNVGQTNQTNLSISSGDDKSTFFVSGQYVTVTGNTPGDKFTRGNLRVNGSRKITDKVNVNYSVGYAPNLYDISSATASIYTNMLNMPLNVDILKYSDWRNTTPGAASIGNPNNFYNPWYLNPYFSAGNWRELDKNNFLTGNIELKISPIQGLDLIARQGIANRDYWQKSTVGAYQYSYYAKHTPLSSKTDIPASVSEISMWTLQSITDFIAQYNKSISSFHVQLTGGMQLIENQAKYYTMSVSGLQVPGLFNITTGLGTPTVGQANIKTRLVGGYAKATVSYNDWLFLTATGRNDWDSRLDPSNRSFFYPSTEVSAVLSDVIPALKEGFVSYLKLRGGMSQTGQVNLAQTFMMGNVPFSDFGAYALNTTFSSNAQGFPYGSLAGYSINSRLVAKGLKPELTKQYEFGVDANLLKDRINASVTYFHSQTSNQTISTGASWASGFSSLLTNVGVTQSEGIEANLKVTAFKNQDWNVTVGGNYTYLNNSVISITPLVPTITLATSGNAASQVFAGKSFPVITGYDYVRDPKGRVVVNGTTGLPTQTSNIVVLGNATPRNILGMNAAASYKNFSFSILFEYRGGYSVYNGIGPEMEWSGTSYRSALYNRQSFVYPNSVIQNPDGSYSPNKNVAIIDGNGNNGFWSDGINRQVTSNYVTSGDFMKLREVSLTYNLSPFLTKLGGKLIKGGDISIQGRNLFLWMAKDNYYTDPEYSLASANGRNGTGLNDLSSTPPVRYYGATLNLKF
ncbi:MAG: SusC/RagA family TonB-linked outer membrane protein [Bacteroidetes bacterium]|nr:SusC/RagA family TonB-linked outer membrane protein [Bacteroidota bacterium]MBS1539592.1 SusC/RagA family TonB-linked outer membrane protein [Bacteroidota bacterium]